MSKTDLALQAWSKGPLHPWVIARDERTALFPGRADVRITTFAAIHPTRGETPGFVDYDAAARYIREQIALDASFEIDEAPAATLRADPFTQRMEADHRDGYRGIDNGQLLAKHPPRWARYWLLGRWIDLGVDTPDHWREYARHLERYGTEEQQHALALEIAQRWEDDADHARASGV